MDERRNLIFFVVLSALVLLGWGLLGSRLAPTANPPATVVQGGRQVALPNAAASPGAPTAAPATAVKDIAVVRAQSPRVRIDTPRLQGSLDLKGAKIDDLVLPGYRETIDRKSPPIRLLAPAGTANAYFAQFGWTGTGAALPGPDTVWSADGNLLAQGHPVTLSWTNPIGQRFAMRISLDDRYMFTIDQSVTNTAAAPLTVRPFALVQRGPSKDPSTWTMHVGPTGAFNGAANYDVNYTGLDGTPPGFFARTFGSGTEPGPASFATRGGWLGFADKYWLTALVPPAAPVQAHFSAVGTQTYQADFATASALVAPGKTLTTTTRFFAGAKEVDTLDAYEKGGIILFDRAIDWGWFYWFEKPIFYVLDWLFHLVGNFGFAIILLTILVRGIMFPIAQRQFRSMGAMRVIQPKVKALQERHKDDKARLQQETMKLYQAEKVNPVAGCLPTLIQIPIFYALYKVLMLSIEMRHQPFIFWIKDLSAPDPVTPVNLFGLLPFEPTGYLHLGVLAICLGITSFLQFRLNPQPMDDAQKQVFQIMPWMLMFIMSPFAAGLQLYWMTTNLLVIAQQKFLYMRHPEMKPQPNP